MFPFVVKKLFHLLLQTLTDPLAIIEMLNAPEKFRKIVCIAQFLTAIQILFEDLNEMTHNVGEDCYSEEQRHGTG